MSVPDHDPIDPLFEQLRATPPDADASRVLPALETRVIARIHAARTDSASRWFWRWSLVFGAAAIVCLASLGYELSTLANESFNALDTASWIVSIGL